MNLRTLGLQCAKGCGPLEYEPGWHCSVCNWTPGQTNHYLDFVMKMFLAFGLAFENPVATLLLAWSGLTTADAMAAKRPYIIIGCFIIGMFLTPPDVVSQLLLALPMWLLFEVGVMLARVFNNQDAEEETTD